MTRVDRRARVHAVLRGEARRSDPELLQRVGEGQRQVGVVLRVIVHGAVEQVGHAEGQAAGDGHVDAAAEAAAVRAAGVDGGARPARAGCVTSPSLERQLEDAFVFNHLADAGAADVHQRRRGFNRHRSSRSPSAERHVDGRRGGDLEHDAGLHVGAESLSAASSR